MRPDLAPLNLLFFQCLFAASGGGALLPQEDIEKKQNLTELSQDAKKNKFNFANFILIL